MNTTLMLRKCTRTIENEGQGIFRRNVTGQARRSRVKDITLMIKENKEGKLVLKAITPLTSKTIMIDLNGDEIDVKVYND